MAYSKEVLAELELTPEQVEAIHGKTGVKVSSLEILSVLLTGDAALNRGQEGEGAVLVVACW
jgi:hypothetical protein